MEFYSSGQPMLLEEETLPNDTQIHDDDPEAVQMIKELLEVCLCYFKLTIRRESDLLFSLMAEISHTMDLWKVWCSSNCKDRVMDALQAVPHSRTESREC